MPYSIHASKDGERAETQRINPVAAAAKARSLAAEGWQVYVRDPAGRHFSLEALHGLTGKAREPILPA